MIPAEISDIFSCLNPFRKKEEGEKAREQIPPPSPQRVHGDAPAVVQPIQPTIINESPSEFLNELQPKKKLSERLSEFEMDYIGFSTWHDELKHIRPINEEGILIKMVEALNTLC